MDSASGAALARLAPALFRRQITSQLSLSMISLKSHSRIPANACAFVTIQALRGRQNRISVEGAAQHFQHAMSLLAQRVQA
jgi:hypothetical protein